MDKIVIFSGTTEGRRLSDILSEQGISHHVCVASDYGGQLMGKNKWATVHVGRMDEDEMKEFFARIGMEKGDIIVDATHPYASQVSENINAAADRDLTIYRAGRESGLSADRDYVNHKTMKDFAAFIDRTEGNILLTTGSNGLSDYCRGVSRDTLDRTFVRIIPAVESIQACTGLGIAPSHILAMQGPFSYELNRAVLLQYDIRHMLTKDSGVAGGTGQKLRAAADSHVNVHILSRPEEGRSGAYTVEEIYEKITGRKYKRRRNIYLCGTGMGDAALLTGQVRKAVRSADALFGAASVIDRVISSVFGGDDTGIRRYDTYRGEDIRAILSAEQDIRTAAVLFSGDAGFYSGAVSCRKILENWAEDADITTLCGVSSVSYMASRLGLAYNDAKICSLHGDNSLHNIYKLACSIRHKRKTFALLSEPGDIRKAAEMLKETGISARIFTGCDLSGPGEVIEELTEDEALRYDRKGKITALFINDDPEKELITGMLPDDTFIRDTVPMTKACVRHESIIRLGICRGDLVYDIGGGTGAVAVEIASLDPSVRVVTIEKDEKAAGLIEKNIKKAGLGNIRVIKDDAVKVLLSLEKPDRVFIGGSSGKMRDIISAISQKGTGIRYVVNAVTFETADEVRRIMDELRATDIEVFQLAVSDMVQAGEYHMLKANNPVMIFAFTI